MLEDWLIFSLPMLIVGGIAIQKAMQRWKSHPAVSKRVIGGATLCVVAIAGDNLWTWYVYPLYQETIESSALVSGASALVNVAAGGVLAVGVWLLVKAAFFERNEGPLMG